MASFPGGAIAPVTPNGSQGFAKGKGKGGHQNTGIDRYAAQIVEDEDLLAEVLRRASLICPDATVTALVDGFDRTERIREGLYFFGAKADGGK